MKPTARTLERISKLKDPSTLDGLLDMFQSLGVPMGSNRWAEYCRLLVQKLNAESITLGRMEKYIRLAELAYNNSSHTVYAEKLHRLLTEE